MIPSAMIVLGGASSSSSKSSGGRGGGGDSRVFLSSSAAAPSSSSSLLYRKSSLLLLLFVILFVICNHWDGVSLFKALQLHQPSRRIFRSLSEIALAFVCIGISLYVWITTDTIGSAMVGRLLFQPLAGWNGDIISPLSTARQQHHDQQQQQQQQQQQKEIEEEEDNDEEEKPLNEEEASGSVDKKDDDDNNDNDDIEKVPAATADDDYDDDYVDDKLITNIMSSYVPTPSSVFNASLDLYTLIMVAFLIYVMAASEFLTISWTSSNTSNTESSASSSLSPTYYYAQLLSLIAAPMFPLLLFIYLAVSCFIPYKTKRKQFWLVVYQTISAPMSPVTFRDGFIGDILTSTVRPMQDIVFTIYYIMSGLQGYWSDSYFYANANGSTSASSDQVVDTSSSLATTTATTTATSALIERTDNTVLPAMERSWLLHTVILPMCMISPLWWRFMQNLRQCYESKQRWPYLGNAFKYFIAAQVAMIGVFHPTTSRSSFLWIISFVSATLYQIWWDIMMDWGLPQKTINNNNGIYKYKLRDYRLYKSTNMYYIITIINILLRFCWTLSFVPPRYLDPTGVLKQNDISLLGPIIACAEIIRRSLWGLLRLEWEIVKDIKQQQNHGIDTVKKIISVEDDIKWAKGEKILNDNDNEDDNENNGENIKKGDGFELTPMNVQTAGGPANNDGNNNADMIILNTTLSANDATSSSSFKMQSYSDMSNMNDIQILAELSIYAGTFAFLGLIFAAHRGTQ